MINIACPMVGEEEIEAVARVMRTGALAQGKEVELFEQEFALAIGVKHAIATSNGSTALLVALESFQFAKGSEVITTAFTFLASASSIVMAGLTPVFVDINKETFCINEDLIEAAITDKTVAIMPVHLYGNVCEMDKIREIAKKHNLKVIEDCAQSHLSSYKNQMAGSMGDLGCFSFYPTKNMTTGEGGMITTNNDALARLCKLIRAHGMDGPYNYVVPGFNHRLTNIGAAIGREQLKKLPAWNKKRKENAKFYGQHLKYAIIPYAQQYVDHSFHQYTIKVDAAKRDLIKQELAKQGINCGIYYPEALYNFPIMSKYKADCKITEDVCKKVLSLPIHPHLTKEELEMVVEVLNKTMEKV